MAVLGTLLKNRRAGQAHLAWNTPNLAGADTLGLTSPDFEHEGAIPIAHASRRAGGKDLSPALTWSGGPTGTAQLLLVVEDPDAPTRKPFVHCVALLEPALTGLPQGALDAKNPAVGVRILRSGMGRGYLGPAPIKGHGPHRYVFQLFALARPVRTGSDDAVLESAKPRGVLAAAGDVLARGRVDGFYERRLRDVARPRLAHAGVEDVEGLAGRVEVGVLTQGPADAVTVELLPHRAEDGAEHQVHMMLVNVLDDLVQDRGRGVVHVPDGGKVDDQPAQRAAMTEQCRDIIQERAGVGVVQARAEPVDHQSLLGAGTWPGRDRQPVSFL